MLNNITIQILSLIIAGTPISFFIVKYIQKFFLQHNNKYNKVSIICTEIDGILTEVDFSVKTLIFDEYRINIEENNEKLNLYHTKNKQNLKIEKSELRKEENIKLIATISTLCHHKKLEEIEVITNQFLKECKLIFSSIKNSYKTIDKIPEEKDKKISTIIALKKETKEIFAFSKGHPYEILERSKRILLNGKKVEIDSAIRKKLKDKIKSLNKNGQKVIAFAYKGLPAKQYKSYSSNFAENDLILIGLVGLGKHLKTSTTKQIQEFKNLGIKLYITTKEKEREAVAIAQELKIINKKYFESIENEYLNTLNEHKLHKLLTKKDKDYVFSNLSKENKNLIIQKLEENKETVIQANKKSNTLEKILNKIHKNKIIEVNQKKIYEYILQIKIIEIFIILIAFILKAPMPITIEKILILELVINTILALSIQSNSEKLQNTNHIKIIIKALITGIIIVSLYLWSLTRLGWYPSGINLSSSSPAALISINIVFSLLVITQIINAHILNKKQNIYIYLTSIISLLSLYFLVKLELSNWLIISYISAIIIVSEVSFDFIIQKIRKLSDK